jgi:uncharacterized protein (TIGR02246 family)
MRGTTQALVLALLPALGLAACGQQPEQEGGAMEMAMEPAELRSAIESLTAEWETAFNAGDAAAVAEVYAEDATLMPDGRDIVTGRDAIRQFWSGAMAEAPEGVVADLETLEVRGAGNLAYEIGRYTDRAGDEVVERGKYLVVWKQQADGTWKIVADIWNRNESPEM